MYVEEFDVNSINNLKIKSMGKIYNNFFLKILLL